VRTAAALDAGTVSAAAAAGQGWVGIYGALGSGAAAFAGTFFVAPLFRDKFKEGTPWEQIYEALSKQGVASISPAEAAKRRGATLLDVRLSDAVEKRSVSRAVAVPLYVPIRNWDIFSNVRRVAFAFFGIAGTELNPAFVEQVAAVTKGNKNAELVVMCERGGSLETRPQMKMGFQSRSLKALYYLRQAGYRNVRHMTGGVTAWAAEGLPVQDAE
jgi:rhodanese-related sulfurtransferase